MNNLQEASNLISDILDLELGVGDIFESGKAEFELIKITKKGESLFYHEHAGYVGQIELDDLKLKQRNITLPMVLEAIEIKKKELLIDQKGKMIQWEWNGIKDILKVKAVWQLRKDGKDLSLFDQKNEKLYKFIINTLGESK